MALELRGRVFFQLPVRYAANAANAFKPFIPEPADGTAISGIIDNEGFIAVRGNFSLVSHPVNGLDTMQDALSRGPQFDFINQSEQLDAFAIKSFCRFFSLFLRHNGWPMLF